MKLHSLATRVSLLVGLAAAILLAAAALFMDQLVDAKMQDRFDMSLRAQAQVLAATIKRGSGRLRLEDGRFQSGLRSSVDSSQQSLMVRCENGETLSLGKYASSMASIRPDFCSSGGCFMDVGKGSAAQRLVQMTFDPESGASGAVGSAQEKFPCRLLLMQSRESLDSALLAIDAILLLIPTGVLLLVLAFSPLLVRRGLIALSHLREHMRGIGPQVPGQRLPASGIRELTPLVERFNEVLERMDQGVARERRFAGAVAHETRTLLAELHTLVDVERRYPRGRSMQAVLDEVADICADLESTVATLLLLTRLEAGLEILQTEDCEPAQIVRNQLERVEAIVESRDLEVLLGAQQPGLHAHTDCALLDIIVGNLISNACNHAPAHSCIEVNWDSHALRINNDAPNLEAVDVAHFGQRQWRKHPGGKEHAGLGLSLAGAASRALGFDMTFRLDSDRRLRTSLNWSRAVDPDKP